MAYELIKVSELPELTTPSDANVLPIQDGDYLKRISFEHLKDAATDDVSAALTTEANARGTADAAILADLAAPYDATKTYALGAYCTNGNQTYRSNTAITTAEAWTAAHWDAVPLGNDLSDLKSALTAEYSSSNTYAIGDYCFHNGQLYRCRTAITTAEAWNSEHWQVAEFGSDVSGLKSALSILDVSNLLTWTQGYYQNNGTTTTQHQFSNMYSNIISAKMFKKIKIFLDTNRQVCVARFNKDTGAFIERTAWAQGYLEVTNDADVAINIATANVSDITLNDLLTRIKIYSDLSESSEILNSIVKKTHIVYQGWAQASQKPQTYYATYAGVDLAVDDTITAKSGFEVAVVNSSGSTIKVWGSAWTISSALSNANIIIRRTNGSAEMLLSDTGYLLSNYILEDYDTTNPQCLAYAVYGSTYNVLAEEIRKSLNASKWSGGKAAFVGDSITAGVNTTQGNIYYQLLNAMIGFSSVYADGVAGSCYSVTSDYGSSITPITQRYQNIPTDSDLVVIFAGQNDFGHDTPIGTIADTTDISFYGALSVVINGILEANPDVRLVLFTPTHRYGFTSGAYQNDTDPNGEGHTLKDYVDAIKDIAEMYGVPVIDLFSVSSLNPRISTIKSNYVTDGLHPNADGHYLLANRILPLLETM